MSLLLLQGKGLFLLTLSALLTELSVIVEQIMVHFSSLNPHIKSYKGKGSFIDGHLNVFVPYMQKHGGGFHYRISHFNTLLTSSVV